MLKCLQDRVFEVLPYAAELDRFQRYGPAEPAAPHSVGKVPQSLGVAKAPTAGTDPQTPKFPKSLKK
eukprot:1349637-Amphidinium_carterae.1